MPGDLVAPRRRVRVLEVGHEAAGARVQRVDDELAIGRAGDLDAPVGVVGPRRRDAPVGLADVARLGQEVERPAAPQRLVALAARGEQLAAPRAEAVVEPRDERDRVGGEDLAVRERSSSRGSTRSPRSRPRPQRRARVRTVEDLHGVQRPGPRGRAPAGGSAPGSGSRCSPVATRSAPVARRLRALRSPSSAAVSGFSTLYVPADPQHSSHSAGSHERDVADRAQERARRVAHALRVREVAGVVVGDRRRPLAGGRRRAAGRGRRGTPLTSTTRAARRSAARLLGLAGEEQPVLAHPRAAPGGVRDDRVDVVGEGVEVAPRERAGLVGRAGVQRQRRRSSPAPRGTTVSTPLRARTRSVAQPMSGREHLLRAAGQQRHARAARALARGAPRAAAGRGAAGRAAGAASRPGTPGRTRHGPGRASRPSRAAVRKRRGWGRVRRTSARRARSAGPRWRRSSA